MCATAILAVLSRTNTAKMAVAPVFCPCPKWIPNALKTIWC